MIKLSQPIISSLEKKAVLKVLKSGYLAHGIQVTAFENIFAAHHRIRHAIATSSGTTALHTILLAHGIGNTDLVITTPLSFIATSNAILFCGAKPIFCDINSQTYNLDPNLVETVLKKKKRIKGILLVHLYGFPCDMDAFKWLSNQYGVPIIEDCAQSVGASYKNKHVGGLGSAGCFSFYATKNMTTGEGGMITTNNNSIAEHCRRLVNHGRVDRFHYNILGYNYRMTNIAAALGSIQLTRLDQFTQRRVANARYYSKALKDIKWIVTPFAEDHYTHVFHQYPILVSMNTRNRLLQYLKDHDVDAAAIYPLTIPEQPLYKKMGYKTLPVAYKVSRKVICLPVHPNVKRQDINKIICLIKEFRAS